MEIVYLGGTDDEVDEDMSSPTAAARHEEGVSNPPDLTRSSFSSLVTPRSTCSEMGFTSPLPPPPPHSSVKPGKKLKHKLNTDGLRTNKRSK